VLNTLKFISAWNYPFDPHRTTPQPYTTDDKQKHTVQMMHRIFEEADALQWQERPDYEAAALGLGRDPESGGALLKLIIIRPKTQWLGAREWLTQVKAGKIPDWLRSKDFDPATGVVSLPRTYARSVQNILQPLKDIGAKPVFEASSTPDAGTAEKVPALPAGNFLQHVVLHLVESTGAPPPNVKSIERLETPGSYVMMRVNRSFVFALVDNKSGVALALGVINKPGLPPEQRK
jgi:serine protease inhibitor